MSFKHQVVRGSAYLSLRLAAGAGIGLVGISLLTRFIGPANYGIFVAAHAVLVYFITMTECGIGVYLIRLDRATPATRPAKFRARWAARGFLSGGA